MDKNYKEYLYYIIQVSCYILISSMIIRLLDHYDIINFHENHVGIFWFGISTVGIIICISFLCVIGNKMNINILLMFYMMDIVFIVTNSNIKITLNENHLSFIAFIIVYVFWVFIAYNANKERLL